MSSEIRSTVLHTPKSKQYAQALAQVIPGGVNSPFRSFEEVGGHTIFIDRSCGSRLFDVDGNSYIDYLGAWGPAILGHSPPAVIQACTEALLQGPVFGSPHLLELEMSQLVISAVPSIEKIRFVNSGTEAVMSAVRLARGFTKKDMIVLFEGGYHGHSDSTLCSQTHQSSSGVPKSTAQHTVQATFNNIESARQLLQAHKGEVAAVVVEPVCGSMGVIPPQPGFLQELRDLCSACDVLLIFDEVLTGFRVAFGGAQNLFAIKPDLTCFGKALGGGMPIGAYGGTSAIMDHLQPLGDVYQAGTFSGNPVTMAGGIATLKMLADPSVYKTLENRTHQLFEGMQSVIDRKGLSIQLQRVGSMFGIIFSEGKVKNYQDSLKIDAQSFASFFHKMLAAGIYLPPSSVDAACVSSAHSEQDIEETVRIFAEALLHT